MRWSRRYPFRNLGAPTVERLEDSDGPPSWRVTPCAGRKRLLDIESCRDEASARQSASRIASIIAHP